MIKQWVNKNEPIFALYDISDFRIVGFCNENDLKLLKENVDGKFIFDSGDLEDLVGVITQISNVSVHYLEFPELSSDFGGTIATRTDNNRLKTEQAYYKVTIKLQDKILDLKSRKTGIVVTQGEYSSLISKITNKVLSVIIRESEF